MKQYDRILVCIDLSPNSLPPLKEALAIRDESTELTGLHVVPESGPEAESFQRFYQIEGSEESLLRNYALPWLENWLKKVEVTLPRSMELEARVGEPAEEIIEFAEQQGTDLIVMGTHGRQGIKRYWMGSVAEAVVRRASCPVMTVRAQNPQPGVIEQD